MLNCWRVNKYWIVDITEFLVQKLSAVFATKSLLELGGDECDNLNFMNFKIDSFKIRKKSWILGYFKIRKIRILNLWYNLRNFWTPQKRGSWERKYPVGFRGEAPVESLGTKSARSWRHIQLYIITQNNCGSHHYELTVILNVKL